MMKNRISSLLNEATEVIEVFTRDKTKVIRQPIGTSLTNFIESDMASNLTGTFTNLIDISFLNQEVLAKSAFRVVDVCVENLVAEHGFHVPIKDAYIEMQHHYETNDTKLKETVNKWEEIISTYISTKNYIKSLYAEYLEGQKRVALPLKNEIVIPIKVNYNMVKNQDGLDVSALSMDIIGANIYDLCVFLFMEIKRNNRYAKKCAHCGKYFLLDASYKTEYCDRIYQDTQRSCRELGAAKRFSAKIKSDPVLESYNKAYKTHFARIRYGKITKEEFQYWAQTAKQKCDDCRADILSLEEFQQWLKI